MALNGLCGYGPELLVNYFHGERVVVQVGHLGVHRERDLVRASEGDVHGAGRAGAAALLCRDGGLA